MHVYGAELGGTGIRQQRLLKNLRADLFTIFVRIYANGCAETERNGLVVRTTSGIVSSTRWQLVRDGEHGAPTLTEKKEEETTSLVPMASFQRGPSLAPHLSTTWLCSTCVPRRRAKQWLASHAKFQ
jgi:hypothetical protein